MNDALEIQVTDLSIDGEGLCLAGKDRIRVRGGLPGDLVRARITKRRGQTVHTEVAKLLEPSNQRHTPACPAYQACGGCDLGALQPTHRLLALGRMVQRQLRLPEPPAVVPSPRQNGHRARIKLAVDGLRLGYRQHRSHTIVDIPACGVARPEIQKAMARLRDVLPLPGIEEVELRSDGRGVAFAFTGRSAKDPLIDLGDVALNGRAIAGSPARELCLPGMSLRASPKSFYQVNLEANIEMVEFIREQVAFFKPECILDLYAGIGNLSIPMARMAPVTAVEREGQATEDLRVNAANADVPVRIVTRAVEKLDVTRIPFDLAVLDPPRAGAPRTIEALLLQRPRALIYVSCNLSTGVRDLRPAFRAGYTLHGVRGFDFFPDTHHLETVLTLRR